MCKSILLPSGFFVNAGYTKIQSEKYSHKAAETRRERRRRRKKEEEDRKKHPQIAKITQITQITQIAADDKRIESAGSWVRDAKPLDGCRGK